MKGDRTREGLIWTSPRKQVLKYVKFQRGCSLIYGLFVQAFFLLALMVFASKVPICKSSSTALLVTAD